MGAPPFVVVFLRRIVKAGKEASGAVSPISSDAEDIRVVMLPGIKLTRLERSMESYSGGALLKSAKANPADPGSLFFDTRLYDDGSSASAAGLIEEPGFAARFCNEYDRAEPQAEADDQQSPKRTQENLAPWRVKRAKALMIELMDQGCSIERVANECAISRSHFSRAFKNATGLAPHDWLRQEKIRRAEALLRTGRVPISRVAQECGFSDQSYFTRVFRQLKGVSPRRWQSQNCGEVTHFVDVAASC
jgi:AraC-like DNA-binding protein